MNPTKKSFSLTTKIEIFFAHVTIMSTAVAHFSIEFYIRQCLHVSLVPYWCIYMYFYCPQHASGRADPSQIFFSTFTINRVFQHLSCLFPEVLFLQRKSQNNDKFKRHTHIQYLQILHYIRVVSTFLSSKFDPKSRWLFPFYFSNITLRTDVLKFGVTGTVFKIASLMHQLPAYFDNPVIYHGC